MRGKGVGRCRDAQRNGAHKGDGQAQAQSVAGDAAVRSGRDSDSRVGVSPRAGSRAQRRRKGLSDLDWTGMEKERGERGGRQGGAGWCWVYGPRTGQPRAKNSHCEQPGQRRRALLEPRCGWRGPSRRRCGTSTFDLHAVLPPARYLQPPGVDSQTHAPQHRTRQSYRRFLGPNGCDAMPPLAAGD
ncbi:hypothetical protein M440DRAFT_1391700 [Trichoderma longibrachiatum ATCC 18648]|uniref:Uncharacterized protein n=1 Tax=Trichoderma longibrachiatum ATCC 18648 TaxID=983965 RepID=A0A2T4C3J0_TRILO|nr:hypothetical protein M440DRAFT_1391700 [Trichoderma longibrachiatum ATCC 18648]